MAGTFGASASDAHPMVMMVLAATITRAGRPFSMAPYARPAMRLTMPPAAVISPADAPASWASANAVIATPMPPKKNPIARFTANSDRKRRFTSPRSTSTPRDDRPGAGAVASALSNPTRPVATRDTARTRPNHGATVVLTADTSSGPTRKAASFTAPSRDSAAGIRLVEPTALRHRATESAPTGGAVAPAAVARPTVAHAGEDE
jgi:hypothetical protein